MAISRIEILERVRAEVAAGRPIVGCGAGTGLSAKSAEAGGADLIIIYNSGRYRMAGRGSLAGLMPYGDANGVVVEMAAEVLPVVMNTPVLAGVCGTDPFRLMPVFLKQLKEIQAVRRREAWWDHRHGRYWWHLHSHNSDACPTRGSAQGDGVHGGGRRCQRLRGD